MKRGRAGPHFTRGGPHLLLICPQALDWEGCLHEWIRRGAHAAELVDNLRENSFLAVSKKTGFKREDRAEFSS